MGARHSKPEEELSEPFALVHSNTVQLTQPSSERTPPSAQPPQPHVFSRLAPPSILSPAPPSFLSPRLHGHMPSPVPVPNSGARGGTPTPNQLEDAVSNAFQLKLNLRNIKVPALNDLLKNLSPREQREILATLQPSSSGGSTASEEDDVNNIWSSEERLQKYATRYGYRIVTFGDVVFLRESTEIGLCSQGFASITPKVHALQHVTLLQLCCNLLEKLPVEIGYLTNLKVLSVAKNKLRELPCTIGLLSNLTELDASENQLTTMPRTIGLLKKLENLFLQFNQLTQFEPEVANCTSLLFIDVRGNPLKSLPAELLTITALHRIETEQCPIYTSIAEIGSPSHPPPSLKELTARFIVTHTDTVNSARLPQQLQDYLMTSKTCTTCGGPYFTSHLLRYKMITRYDATIPLQYRLCSLHWTTEDERLRDMFSRSSTRSSMSSSLSLTAAALEQQRENQPNGTIPRTRRGSMGRLIDSVRSMKRSASSLF